MTDRPPRPGEPEYMPEIGEEITEHARALHDIATDTDDTRLHQLADQIEEHARRYGGEEDHPAMTRRYIALTIETTASAAAAEQLATNAARTIERTYPGTTARIWETWNPEYQTPDPIPQDPAAAYATIEEEERQQ